MLAALSSVVSVPHMSFYSQMLLVRASSVVVLVHLSMCHFFLYRLSGGVSVPP